MIKKMCVNININTECDTPQMVKDLIYALMSEAGDRTFAIESVTIDNEENFKVGHGWMGDMARHFVG
ncbi:MAG: hypothetical protein ACK5MV_12625 [Aminipila sp.]